MSPHAWPVSVQADRDTGSPQNQPAASGPVTWITETQARLEGFVGEPSLAADPWSTCTTPIKQAHSLFTAFTESKLQSELHLTIRVSFRLCL